MYILVLGTVRLREVYIISSQTGLSRVYTVDHNAIVTMLHSKSHVSPCCICMYVVIMGDSCSCMRYIYYLSVRVGSLPYYYYVYVSILSMDMGYGAGCIIK
jgi:hypothetical protein